MPRSLTGRELKTFAVASPLFASSENVTQSNEMVVFFFRGLGQSLGE
jgi:hypothetical protein